MKLKSIETRDELGLVAFGPRSRVFEVGVSSTAELYLDLPNRIVWLRAVGQEVAHGIPLEQVRRFTPLASPEQKAAAKPTAQTSKASRGKAGDTKSAAP